MYTNNRDAYRNTFIEAWIKHQKQLPLEPMEAAIIQVILLHPAYQRFLIQDHQLSSQEFAVEENPFIHMSLHLAVRDQINLDRPPGIRAIHTSLLAEGVAAHEAEHDLMQALQKTLWQAQQSGCLPSDEMYLDQLRSNNRTKL